MTDETAPSERTDLSDEEVEAQAGEELPERAAMSVLAPEPVLDDAPWIVDDRTDDMPPNPMPFPKESE